MTNPARKPKIRMNTREVILLALVLVAAHKALPTWVFSQFPQRQIFDRIGSNAYFTLFDAVQGLLPLILCLGAARRSGLRWGLWRGRVWPVVAICVTPIVLTAAIYPFTSQPFKGDRVGVWLVSPAAQELLFAGYLYGLLDAALRSGDRWPTWLRPSMLVTAGLFAAWHLPNLLHLSAGYVVFQLLYTFLGALWMLQARRMTRSVLPGIATHMAVNFLSWVDW